MCDSMLEFIKNISPTEFGILALLLIVIFGSKTVTKLGKTGGQTLKEIKNIKKTFTQAIEDDDDKEVSS